MRRDIIRARVDAERKQRTQQTSLEYQLGVLRRARLESAKILESAEWQVYCERIQALNEKDQSALDGLLSMSDMGTYLTPEQCQSVEFHRSVLKAKIQARNECIEIPKTILSGTASESD